MASMSNAVATLAAVPPAAAGLRMESLESAIRSSPSSLLMGSQKKTDALVSIRGSTFVARASASEQESQIWNVAKGAAAAAAISLMLSASPVEAREGRAFQKYTPNNTATEAESNDLPNLPKKSVNTRNILESGKEKRDVSFAEAEKTVQAARVLDAQPAISELKPKAQEVSDVIGNSITAKADAAADLAPKISQPAVKKKGPNPMKKTFAATTRGLGDKAGKTESRTGSLPAKETLPRNNKPYKQGTGIVDRIYNSFKAAGEGRDAGVGVRAQ